MRSSPPPARRPGQTVRWLAVAAGAVLLASCRSISLTAPVSALAPLPAVAVTSADAADTVDPVPLLPVESPTAAAELSERSFPLATIHDGDVQRTGLDLPSPPLPRLGQAGPAAAFPVAAVAGGRCQGPDCQPHAGPESTRYSTRGNSTCTKGESTATSFSASHRTPMCSPCTT